MPSASWYTGINAGEVGAISIGTLAAANSGATLQSGGGTIFTAWGGGVLTTQGVYVGATFYAGPALVTFGGGHTDYSGNEVYAIVDLAGSPFYARLRDKSSPDIVNADSNGGGDPVARHSYQTIQAIDDGSRNWMFSSGYLFRATDSGGSSVCHYFDFGTASPNSNQPWSTKASQTDGACDISVYDATNGRLWAHASAANEVSFYSPAANTWSTALFKSPLIGTNAHSALDISRNLWFAVWAGATTVQGFDTTDTAFATDYYSVNTTGTAPTSANAKSIVYDSVDDRFVVWAGGNTLYFLKAPASSPGNGGNAWTWTSKTFTGATVPAVQTNGTFGRFTILPAPNRGYLLWVDSTSTPFFFRPDSAFVGPTIDTQPADQSAYVGEKATFSIAATVSAGGGSISGYQWQDNSSGSFADISGATSASLAVTALSTMDGRLYRCNVTDSNGTHTSNAATLRVRWPVSVPQYPGRKRRPIGAAAFDPAQWVSPSLNPANWFAPELTTATSSAAALAATPAGVATATGALTTAIQLAAAPAGVAATTGALSTGIRLAATPATVGAATGALTTAIQLAAVPAALAVATGAITTAIQLAAAPTGVATATGDLATGSAAALAATPAAVAAATGSLSTSIRLAGAPSAAATATGALTTAIQLAAAPVGAATATGALTTAIQLAAAPVGAATATGDLTAPGSGLAAAPAAVAAATGALTTGIRLNATPAATATATGLVGSAVPLAATPAGVAAATGALATSIRLNAAPTGTATATGALTTAVRLAAAAIADAQASAALTTAIRLAATPAAVATATGGLGALAALAATPAAVSSATGALATGIRLNGAAAAVSSAVAALLTLEQFRAAAVASASSPRAYLTTANAHPTTRICDIEAESRWVEEDAENRWVEEDAEGRLVET